jgi:hypothetical protein
LRRRGILGARIRECDSVQRWTRTPFTPSYDAPQQISTILEERGWPRGGVGTHPISHDFAPLDEHGIALMNCFCFPHRRYLRGIDLEVQCKQCDFARGSSLCLGIDQKRPKVNASVCNVVDFVAVKAQTIHKDQQVADQDPASSHFKALRGHKFQ